MIKNVIFAMHYENNQRRPLSPSFFEMNFNQKVQDLLSLVLNSTPIFFWWISKYLMINRSMLFWTETKKSMLKIVLI